AVSSGYKNNYFLLVGYHRFIFLVESRVIVWSLCFEFRGTGINELVHPIASQRSPLGVHFTFEAIEKVSDLAICISVLFRCFHEVRRDILDRVLFNLPFEFDEFFYLLQVPTVDLCQLLNFLVRNNSEESSDGML